jgi:hypothetical protein
VQQFFQHEFPDSMQVSFDNGTWINIPLFTGFSLRYAMNDQLSFDIGLQGGINISREASRRTMVNGIVAEETTFEFAPDFGYEVSCGVQWHGKYKLGIRYIDLSSPRYEGMRRLNEEIFTTIAKREMNVDGDRRPVAGVMVFAGFTL